MKKFMMLKLHKEYALINCPRSICVNLPPKIVLSVMKYVEMGSVIMANVNARSLYITALCPLPKIR